MLILKHLKTLQHVSIIIQIIFRELVIFLVKVTEFNKEYNELPEDDLNNDRNMLERF